MTLWSVTRDSPVARELIAHPAATLNLQHVELSEPRVEAVQFENGGRRGVALMNGAYRAHPTVADGAPS